MRLKRTILSLFTILLLVGLTACSKPEIPTTQVWNEERQYFTFPGVKWGMTQEEWITSWKLTEQDYEKSVVDEDAKVNASEETISYHLKEKLKIWEYSADLTVTFAKFPKEEAILVDVKAVFSGDDEEAIVERFQKEFHSNTSGYNTIVSAQGKIMDLDETLRKEIFKLYEDWEKDTSMLETFGMSFFTWTWDETTKNVTIDCSGIPAAVVYLAEQKKTDL